MTIVRAVQADDGRVWIIRALADEGVVMNAATERHRIEQTHEAAEHLAGLPYVDLDDAELPDPRARKRWRIVDGRVVVRRRWWEV